MTTNTGIPAFPVASELCQDLTVLEQRGMTLRDYFAAKAMQGLIIQNKFIVGMGEKHLTKQAADYAYRMADAMLRERG